MGTMEEMAPSFAMDEVVKITREADLEKSPDPPLPFMIFFP
jgi:hypothetical protein